MSGDASVLVAAPASVEWIVGSLLPDPEALELLTPLAVAVDSADGPGLEGLVGFEVAAG